MSSVVASAGGAALRAAAVAGDCAACARLLGSAKCVRFSRDELGRSALHLAASAGHGPVVRQLLNVAAPKEVDSPDGAGCTALQRAAADGHEEVVKLLLARGADVDKQDSVVSQTLSKFSHLHMFFFLFYFILCIYITSKYNFYLSSFFTIKTAF